MISLGFYRWGCASSGPPSRSSERNVRAMVILVLIALANGSSAHAQFTTEAGLNDLVILDPGQHERGLPAVIVTYMDQNPGIEIPPKVHVHRYFYSGDKVFQGPIIQGGPVVLAVKHPKTGVQMYVDVVLPPGAPRIAHRKNSIFYIYGKKRVEIKFQHFPFDPCVAVVKHHSGRGLGIALRDKHEHVHDHVYESLENSESVNAMKDLASGGHNLVKGAATSLGHLSTRGVDSVKQLAKIIPGITYLASKSEQKPQRDYESTVRTAQRKNERTQIPFVRTNR